MLSTFAMVATVVAEAETHHRDMPMPPWAFGLLALVLFTAGLLALFSFRNTAFRAAERRDAAAGVHGAGRTGETHGGTHH